MASKQMVRMSQGQGETSYALNSSIQNTQQNRMKPLIEEAIVDLCSSNNTSLPRTMLIADLGCSSGPNALTLVSTVIEAIQSHYLQFQQPPPEVCVLLNGLPDNDFNTVVKSLVDLRQSNKPVIMTGVIPGSFYERLFTSDTLHLVCSSNSLHWLSKAPEDLTRNQIPAYDIDEHARRDRLPMVIEAYAKQFRKDFTLFLEIRAKELIQGGRMIVSLIGLSNVVATKFSAVSEIVAQILSVMVLEGVIDKAKYDSFYVPIYSPSSEELREIIQEEGSFSIKDMHVHDPTTTDVNHALNTPSKFLNFLRALFEPMLVQHFGDVMDEFVRTAERRWSLEGSLQDDHSRGHVATLVVSSLAVLQ